MTPIAVATEDELSEAIALRLIGELGVPHQVTHKLRKNGFGYLQSRMGSWRQMAQRQVVMVLTDLDRADCLLEFRDKWLAGRDLPLGLVFRIAVRQVESWVLADHDAIQELIGAKKSLPEEPDKLPDSKQTLLKLAKNAPRKVQQDLLRSVDGQLRQGIGYNARLCHWVGTQWDPERAQTRSPSLFRARSRLRETVERWTPSSMPSRV